MHLPRNGLPVSNQKINLIETPLPEPFQMKRYRHHNIDAVFIPKKSEGRQEKFSERSGQLNFALIFITMDNLRKYLLVYQRSAGDSKFFQRRAAIAAAVIYPLSAFKRQPAATA